MTRVTVIVCDLQVEIALLPSLVSSSDRTGCRTRPGWCLPIFVCLLSLLCLRCLLCLLCLLCLSIA
jgi:hypothetical protein